MGLSSRIGPTGLDLSGGQIQRILIARAIYKKSSLLILDEATSSLDVSNESEIMSNIKKIYANHTLVIAAHRLCTIINADKILYMENGQITEVGSHSELMALKGGYHNLVINQLELSASQQDNDQGY